MRVFGGTACTVHVASFSKQKEKGGEREKKRSKNGAEEGGEREKKGRRKGAEEGEGKEKGKKEKKKGSKRKEKQTRMKMLTNVLNVDGCVLRDLALGFLMTATTYSVFSSTQTKSTSEARWCL